MPLVAAPRPSSPCDPGRRLCAGYCRATLEQWLVAWSGDRRVRVIVNEILGGRACLLRQVMKAARRTDDPQRLADAVSAIFKAPRRARAWELARGEEIILTLGQRGSPGLVA